MTGIDVKRLGELLAKAELPWGAGPWVYDHGEVCGDLDWCVSCPRYGITGPDVSLADAQLIAEAINALPELLRVYAAWQAGVVANTAQETFGYLTNDPGAPGKLIPATTSYAAVDCCDLPYEWAKVRIIQES